MVGTLDDGSNLLLRLEIVVADRGRLITGIARLLYALNIVLWLGTLLFFNLI